MCIRDRYCLGVLVTGCYTALVFYWLVVILPWCSDCLGVLVTGGYTALVFYWLVVILPWCSDWLLYCLGVLLTGCYTALVFYWLVVILTWCYTPVPHQGQGAAQTPVLLSCRCHQMSLTPCSWTCGTSKIHVTMLNWDRGIVYLYYDVYDT